MSIQGIKINTAYDKPLILNHYTKTKAVIDKESLIKLISETNDKAPLIDNLVKLKILSGERDKLDNKSLAAINHWRKRNWELSLFYYLWSRTGHLVDKGKEYQENQVRTISSYLQEKEIPKEVKPSSILSIPLNEKTPLPNKSIGQVMQEREAVRATPVRTIPIETLSSILWHGFNTLRDYRINHGNIEANPLDAVESFGSAFDVYLCVYTSDILGAGVYYYDITNNTLEYVIPIKDVNVFRTKMYNAQVEQKIAFTASTSILLVCDFARYQWRYRQESALRQIYINCGQITHPLMLLSAAYDYKTHISPAIMDSLALEIVGLPKEKYQVMYVLSIG
jgi:SagB-type dehydrogenase family enzyme